MKKYIVIIILAALIVSCGGKTEVVKEPKSFSFSNDFDGLMKNMADMYDMTNKITIFRSSKFHKHINIYIYVYPSDER